jgi:hypothetical protein
MSVGLTRQSAWHTIYWREKYFTGLMRYGDKRLCPVEDELPSAIIDHCLTPWGVLIPLI